MTESVTTRPAYEVAIDPDIWPDVVAIPRRAIHAAAAERLTKRAVRSLPLRVTTADGQRFGAGTSDDPTKRGAQATRLPPVPGPDLRVHPVTASAWLTGRVEQTLRFRP
jgi:hypothetical protein